MEDEDGQPMTPFWLQSSNTPFRQASRRRRSSPSSIFLNSTTLIILLLTFAAFLFFFIIPSILSFTSQIFKPNIVKKSWDSLNLVLVLFAIICGFLSRTTNYENNKSSSEQLQIISSASSSNPGTPQYQWYGHQYSDRSANNSLSRLRSSSSYPDLRQESSWMNNGNYNGQYKFLDDTNLSNYKLVDKDDRRKPEVDVLDDIQMRRYQLLNQNDIQSLKTMPEVEVKNIEVDTVVSQPIKISQPPPPQPPPSPPPSTVERKTKRTYRHIEKEESIEKGELENHRLWEPPPSPPSSAAKGRRDIEKRGGGSSSGGGSSGKSERKRGGATKDFLTSLYHQKRKKKQRQKSVENLDALLFPPPQNSLLPQPSPPPPPPLPPPSVFQNLFSSKKTKTKKLPSSTTQISLKPPLYEKRRNSYALDENVSSGSESPMKTIPPPPPPFPMSPWRFAVQGDYVRINSNDSSRSGSPDLDELSGGDSPQAVALAVGIFCPSPDVDTKADNFIARFRAGLKLEKMNSIKAKAGVGMSRLGPEPSPKSSPSSRE